MADVPRLTNKFSPEIFGFFYTNLRREGLHYNGNACIACVGPSKIATLSLSEGRPQYIASVCRPNHILLAPRFHEIFSAVRAEDLGEQRLYAAVVI